VNVESGQAASVNGSISGEPDGASGALPGPPIGLGFVRRRPEVLVGAAFAGGVIAAFLLRRLGH
jgi:hypothetical protein